MDKVILNFKLLESEGVSINEFLCLLKVYFSNGGIDIDYDDLYQYYQSLENKKLIKITVETIDDKKEIKYTLRQKAKLLLEASFNEYDSVSIKKKKTVSDKYLSRLVDDNLKSYRLIFKGLKIGAMGSPSSCRNKLLRWLKENPDKTMEDVLKAANLYVKSLEGDYRYLQRADYFIFKKEGKEESSRLSAFVEELDYTDNYTEEGWTNTLI